RCHGAKSIQDRCREARRHMMGTNLRLIKDTITEWSNDNASRLSAALAFYTMLSLAPLLIITVAILGWIFGEDAARGQVLLQAEELVGHNGAEAIQAMITSAHAPTTGIFATILGLATLLIAATGVFVELQDAMNAIWDVQAPRSGT